jgi:hypothetical protein
MKLSTRKPILGMRTGLILLVLLAVLPSLGIILHDGLEHRVRAETEGMEQAMLIAHRAATSQEALIDSGRQLLAALAQHSAVRNLDSESCSSLFADLLPDDTYFTALLAIIPCWGCILQRGILNTSRQCGRPAILSTACK